MSPRRSREFALAFTLIELLAVIAIIGVLVGVALSTAGLATTQSRKSRMRGDHGRIVTAIEAYKADMGSYPPDGLRSDHGQSDTNIEMHIRAGMNSLFYELSGAIYTNANGGSFYNQNKPEQVVRATDLKNSLGVGGVQNSARAKRDIRYRGVSFRENQFGRLDTTDPNSDLEILVAPVKGPYDQYFKKKGGGFLTPWFYTVSTNIHNVDSYDFWGEYILGPRTNVIGNWKD